VRSDVEENLVSPQLACPAVIQVHLECFRRYKTPSPHDQFGACLASKNEIWSTRVAHLVHHAAHFGTMTSAVETDMAKVRQRKRDMVNRETDFHLKSYKTSGDVRTGAPDPPTLHDGSPSPRSRHMPTQ